MGVVVRHFLDLVKIAPLEAAGKEKVGRNLAEKVLNILLSTVWSDFLGVI